jgi:hypothetical protein
MAVQFSSLLTIRATTWTSFKTVLGNKKIVMQWDDDGAVYTIWGYDFPEVHCCTIWKGTVPDGVIAGGYSQSQNDADKADFESASYKPKGNKTVTPTSSEGKPLVVQWPTEGTRKTFITGNWCDKTTWYQKAVRVVDEIADCTNAPTYTTYQVDQTHLIDTYHGKISGEEYLKDSSNNSFRVVVKVNDVTKTEQDPHTGSGGDYTVNYVTGVITFLSPRLITDVVKVTYHYANGSEYVIKPEAGKILKIRTAEVQFTKDIVLTDTVRFQLYVAGNPYGDAVVYKTLMDYINEANGAYPEISSMGGNGWRGLPQNVVTFPWNYQAVTELKSSLAMEIRIKLEHDTPFTGTSATATFYCLSENE